jgi:hypothetical protein
LSGVAHPRLPEFLELVDAATGRVPDLVAELVPIASVPALRARYDASVTAKRVAFDEPWTEAVMRVLETTRPTRGSDLTRIRSLLGLTEEHAQRCLTLLEQAALIRRDGESYECVRELTVDTRGGNEALIATKAHWARFAAERARAPGRRDLFAYNVFSASAADYERIRAMLRAVFRECRSVIAASTPSEEVGLMNLQLVRFVGELRGTE